MPSVSLHTRPVPKHVSDDTLTNGLPHVLQTPSGLAVLEIQGTIHAPFPQPSNDDLERGSSHASSVQTSIGRLEFPLFNPSADSSDLSWMKKVYLYIGKHQRLTGEVKKLPKPLAVVGKKAGAGTSTQISENGGNDDPVEELELLEVVKHKILFGGRPEPVGG